MDAFTHTSGIGAAGVAVIIAWLHGIEPSRYAFVLDGSCPIVESLQLRVGDVLWSKPTGGVAALEIKTESHARPNLFLETWSNRATKRPGWLWNLDCGEVLLYLFLDTMQVYIARLANLRAWAKSASRNGSTCRLGDFPLKQQTRYEQHNDTWGRCVPIAVLRAEAGVTSKDLSQYACAPSRAQEC